MYHYDPNTALEELTEDATLPNPVHVRDMILRKKLGPDKSLELNRLFVEYQKFFGEAQKLGKEILKQLACGSQNARRSACTRRAGALTRPGERSSLVRKIASSASSAPARTRASWLAPEPHIIYNNQFPTPQDS